MGGLDDNDKVIVLPNGVLNCLRTHLEVRMTHPGGTVDTSIINIKQDDRRYLTRNEIQRSYDREYCVQELKDMQIIKENTYPYLFADTSTDGYQPDDVGAATGLHARNATINFPAGSIHAECQEFANELKVGKKFIIHAAAFDKVFQVQLLQPFQGLDMSMKLGRDEDHAMYIEDYSALAQANTAQQQYRFKLMKGGANKVICRYKTSNQTTSVLAKFNEQFENNATVEVSCGLFFKVEHRNVEQNTTEYTDMKFPNTSNMPRFATLAMMTRDDYNHTDFCANYLSDILTNSMAKIKFNASSDLNPTFRDGVAEIDFSNDIDKEEQYKLQRRYMLGMEDVDMSDLLPAYMALNGVNPLLYKHEGESKADFMKMNAGRHLTPIPISMDLSHGKYNPDQKPSTVSNSEVSMDFHFCAPLTQTSVIMLTCVYQGRYVMKKQTNGMLKMSFQNMDIPSNML